MEGLLFNLWRGLSAVAIGPPRPSARASVRLRWPAATRVSACAPVALALIAVASMAVASTAQANQARTIYEKCGHGEPFGGYGPSAYREALKQMPTEISEYTDCANLIRKAELAAAGGGGSAASPGVSANVPLPLSPAEQNAVRSAHHSGSAPVRVGDEPIRPGVVHANIASAVNTLPHSLFAVLALMLAGALALATGEVLRRVRARRHG